jgi:hypothetical protein
VKRGRTSGKAEKALEEWWRSFTIGGELRILLFGRIVLCLLNFERSNFMISRFKKQKLINYCFT